LHFVIISGTDDFNSISHDCSTDELAEKDLNESQSIRDHKRRNEEHWNYLSQINNGHTLQWNMEHDTSDGNYLRRRLQQQNNLINNDNIDIPIIFHILYDSNNNIEDFVTDYSIFIDRLKNINLNFNEENSDISNYPNWSNILGNMAMTFYINRIEYVDVGSNSPFVWFSNTIKTTSSGGHDPIDKDHNLNIWFVRPDSINRFRSAYASFPWDDNTVGIVFNIALINGDWERYNWGQYRTIFTHEIGHWIGLYHIWGCCTYNDNPSCNADDDVVDTPNMGNKWSNQCPNDGVNSCINGEPDMFENFMSYASCINMFTDGQVARARANFMIGGDRDTFIDYKTNEAELTFVNMIYFIGINEKCMIGDLKKYIYSINNGGQYALCVSYSRNPHIYIYNDIVIVKGNNQCPNNNYFKIDNNLRNGNTGNYYLCVKKVVQNNPLSSNTILDIDIIDFNINIINKYNDFIRGYIYHSINSGSLLTWNEAENQCETLHGTSLGIYKSALDFERLINTIGNNKVYIGLIKDDNSNNWEFEDGTACKATNDQNCVNEWGNNQPNNNNNNNKCTEITYNYGLKNIECNNAYNNINGYICNHPQQSSGIGYTLPVNQYFKLQNVFSGNCIYHNSQHQLGFGNCDSSLNQYYWILNDIKYNQNRYRLKNKETNACILNRKYGYFRYPDNWWFTTYYLCLGYADQYWKLYRINGGVFMLKNYHTGACMFQNSDGRFGIAGCNWNYMDQFWRAYY